MKYVHQIPHSGTGESLKTSDKKKKKSASGQLAFTDPRHALQKKFPNFPAGVSAPVTATVLLGPAALWC